MSELYASPSFGIALTVLVYWVGVKIQKKTGLVICNNMIIAVALLIAVLAVFHIPYEDYNQGGSIINMFLGPATACLAVSIYSKIDLLKKNWLPVLVGCVVGVVTSVGSILIMCRLFGLDQDMTISLLPKSVTTPIAVAVSEGHNGMVAITVAAVIVTGEEAGCLEDMLKRLAENYEHEADLALTKLMNLLEPAMILVIGSLTGLLILGIMEPMWNMYGSIGS